MKNPLLLLIRLWLYLIGEFVFTIACIILLFNNLYNGYRLLISSTDVMNITTLWSRLHIVLHIVLGVCAMKVCWKIVVWCYNQLPKDEDNDDDEI